VPRLATAILAALLAVLAVPAVAAAASRKPCRLGASGGPKCTFWNAKATFIADGDTIKADIAGDGTSRPKLIRFTGINTMELSRYSSNPRNRRGACHGLEATSLVERYVKRSHWRVKLAAQHASSRTGKRLRRSVWVRSGGRWVDLARILIEQGHALWLSNPDEWAHNAEYRALAEQAAARQINLYDPDFCGAGPSPEAQLRVSVNWDADGNDERNRNGEWVDVRNLGPAPVPIGGWWVRDSYLIKNARGVPGFEFPAGAVVPAGGAIRLHVGCGEARPTRFYWCQPSTVFENVNPRDDSGDGAYLFDPQGDLRAAGIYPCTVACNDPLKGVLQLSVRPTTPESIAVTNVSNAPVGLAGYLVKLHLNGEANRFIFGYAFDADDQLGPGEQFTLMMDGARGGDGRLVRHLDRGAYVLADGGNVVSLRSASDVVLDCIDWGRRHC
jgi:endonuclease YncB( thermonuclease family)